MQTIVILPQQQRREVYSQRAHALLAGLLVCAGCRKPLNACYRSPESNQQPVCYRHPSAKQSAMTQLCRTSAVNADRLEALVLEQLQLALSNHKIISNNYPAADRIKSIIKLYEEHSQDGALQKQMVDLFVKQVFVHKQHVELEMKISSSQTQVTKVNSKGKKI